MDSSLESNKWLVCIGTGAHQQPLIQAGLKLGFKVLGVDREPSKSNLSDALTISTYETPRVVSEVLRWSRNRNVSGIVSRTSGPALLTWAHTAVALQLPGPGMSLAKASVRKSVLRNFLENRGEASIRHHQSKFWIPRPGIVDFVVKPDMPVVGKKAVRRARSVSEVRRAIREASSESLNRKVEVLEYVEGRDICVLILRDSKGPRWNFIFEEKVEEVSGEFIGRGITSPVIGLDANLEDSILQVATRIGNVWSYVGFAFFSFRVSTSGDFFLYEVNPGLAGDRIVEDLLAPVFPETDFFELDIRVMTGTQINGVEDFG